MICCGRSASWRPGPLLLLRLGFCFAFGHRIDAGSKQLLCSEVKLAGVLGADNRVLPKRHVLLGAIEPVPPKSELSAPKLDEKTQPTTIG